MSKEHDVRKEMIEIHERVASLETKFEGLTKRVDDLSKYLKELYNCLQKEYRRPLI